MDHFLSWDPLLFLLVAMIVVLPGFLCLVALQVRPLLAFAAGPSLTFAIIAVGTVLGGYFDFGWGMSAFLICTAIALVVCRLVGKVGPKLPLTQSPQPYQFLTFGHRLLVLLAIVVGTLSQVLPVQFRVDADFPSALPDQMYHYNGVNAINETGNASPLNGMSPNYGFRISSITYPTIWHAIISLVAESEMIVRVSHTLAYAVIPLIWVSGLSVLAMVTFPNSKWAGVIAPLLAILFPAFPLFLTTVRGFWPNALGLAAVPGLLALGIAFYHLARWNPRSRKPFTLTGLFIIVFGLFGVTMAHPSTAFSLAWTLLPSLLISFVWVIRVLIRRMSRKKVMCIAACFSVVAITIGYTALSNETVIDYMGRETTNYWGDLTTRFVSLFILWPIGDSIASLLIGIIGCVLTIGGLVIVLQRPHTRWIAFGWFMQELLIIGSYFPIWPLEPLAGIWYTDTYRLLAVQVLFAVLLLTAVCSYLLEKASVRYHAGTERSRSLIAGGYASLSIVLIGAILTTASLVIRQGPIYRELSASPGERHIISSEEEKSLLASIDQTIPDDALLLGDPLTGVALAPVMGDRDSVYTQVNIRDWDLDGAFILNKFSEIHSDPRVCQVIEHYGVTHFYEDSSFNFRGIEREFVMPGFYNVDTSKGFTLVAEGGGAKLWRIDVCGESEPTGKWWDLDWRSSPLTEGPFISPAAGSASRESIE